LDNKCAIARHLHLILLLVLIDFGGVGTLEAFNTDGIRTLRKTMNIPNLKEKTLRYPGHANLMRIFRDSGFFSTTPVEVDGVANRPLVLTSVLLFDQWQLENGQEDITIMKVTIEGKRTGNLIATHTICIRGQGSGTTTRRKPPPWQERPVTPVPL
jgi:saccharopine dehydrogenase-like NADP-dependent oxidoreductase